MWKRVDAILESTSAQPSTKVDDNSYFVYSLEAYNSLCSFLGFRFLAMLLALDGMFFHSNSAKELKTMVCNLIFP